MFDQVRDYFDFLRQGDPLVFHFTEPMETSNGRDEVVEKSPSIMFGVKALRGHKYFPSLTSAPFVFKGHGQTAMAEIKDVIKNTLGITY